MYDITSKQEIIKFKVNIIVLHFRVAIKYASVPGVKAIFTVLSIKKIFKFCTD